MICEQLRKADIARLKVEMRALEKGIICSRPVVEGTRYDCILDTGSKLYRAQVKYANGKSSNTEGVVQVNLRKEIRKNRNAAYTDSEIDVLLVYVPKIDSVLVRT
ncbi:MAG: group I intron-associated PD-(D/E)XK endonuclease [Blastocatellia bacterium]|nr:group I intron-associated PD-(D/E)XK endonuclease [Blastocatellia bacterium]